MKKKKIAFILLSILLFFGFISASLNKTVFDDASKNTDGVFSPAVMSHTDASASCVFHIRAYEDNPYNELGLITINSRNTTTLDILQYDQQRRLSDHSIYSSYCSIGDFEKGCSIEFFAAKPAYGDVDITITYNSLPISDKSLERMFCSECRNAIGEIEPQCDLLLIDYTGGRYYDLCKYPYDFTIRDRYSVKSKFQKDGTIKVIITDLKAQELVGIEVPVNPFLE